MKLALAALALLLLVQTPVLAATTAPTPRATTQAGAPDLATQIAADAVAAKDLEVLLIKTNQAYETFSGTVYHPVCALHGGLVKATLTKQYVPYPAVVYCKDGTKWDVTGITLQANPAK